MAKRHRPSHTAPSGGAASSTIPSRDMDSLLQTFLYLADPSSLSLERLLESVPSDSDQCLLIDRALNLGSALLEEGKRSVRIRSSKHNSLAWPLPPDLTVKLDTKSLCHVAASCSLFYTCAKDPLCYANIDLTTVMPKVNDAVVSTMIGRAGKYLKSLKLGVVPGPTLSCGYRQRLVYGIRNPIKLSNQGKESSVLTRSCLYPLNRAADATGTLLERLYLYTIESIDSTALCDALSACPALLDLKIVGLPVDLDKALLSVSRNCPLIERLFVESLLSGRDSLKPSTCVDLVHNCPNIESLALRGYKLGDSNLHTMVKGFHKLKNVDLSMSSAITGVFLRDLGGSEGGNLLEVLILRDCHDLSEEVVSRLLTSIVSGDFKSLRHLDVSNRLNLWYQRRCSLSNLPVKQLIKARPDFRLLAGLPDQRDIKLSRKVNIPSKSSSSDSSDDSMSTVLAVIKDSSILVLWVLMKVQTEISFSNQHESDRDC